MAASEDKYIEIKGCDCTCGTCGSDAGAPHAPYCISNLPGRFDIYYPLWKQGRDDFNRVGQSPETPSNLNPDSRKAYEMGVEYARAKWSSERTIRSLEQGIEMVKQRLRLA